MSQIVISIVIPALNEQRHIGATLERIATLATPHYICQIIVADNGSTDATAAIAVDAGATVVVCKECTIGALRNTGAALADGSILIFLDADVHITHKWASNLLSRLTELERNPRTLMGSICGVPTDATWIERSWFDPSQRNHRITHIGSGHLITTRVFFEELGGFNETMQTGEDYELSARALNVGGRIIDAPDLYVEHLGYPSSLRQFIRREMWHGEGDFLSFGTILRSKVALATVLFVSLHLAVGASLLLKWYTIAIALGIVIALLCVLSALVKYRGRPILTIVQNSILYYFYFCGRAGALYKRLAGAIFPRIVRSSARAPTRKAIKSS